MTKRNGSWGYRVDAGFDPETGTRRQMRRQGFQTKRQAEAALAEVQKTVNDGTVVSTTGTAAGPLPRRLAGGPEVASPAE